ncbi:MAG: hypothetical protein AB7S26_33320 [Sandaracinaceae bacterium]
MRRGTLALGLALLVGCGSRTGLAIPDAPTEDAGAPTPDAGDDAGAPDAGVDAGPPIDPDPDPCVVIPAGPVPTTFDVSFTARIVAADLVFLVDNTSSMGTLIREVQDTLRARLIPALAAAIPDLQMAVAIYRDFGFSPYGSFGDTPIEVLQASTSDVDLLEGAVDRMAERGGGDLPESATEALYQLATGEGLEPFIAPVACPDAGIGAACLRADAVPIVVLFTDAPFHNGPSLPGSYVGVDPAPHGYPATLAALEQHGFRVLGLLAALTIMGQRARDDLEIVARDTGAVTPDGEPIVFDLGGGRRPAASHVIRAVEELVDETTIDVEPVAEDLPGDAVDATRFVRSAVPLAATPTDGATIEGGRFVSVTPGTRVTYRFTVVNDTVAPGPVEQRFGLRLVLRDAGGATLTSRDVELIVPSIDGTGSCG